MLTRIGRSLGAQALSLSLSLVDRVIVIGLFVRAWGAEVYGDWLFLFAAAGFFGLGEAGLGIYFGNAWQKAHATSDETTFARLVSVCLFCFSAIAIASVIVLFLVILLSASSVVASLSSIPTKDGTWVFGLLAAAAIAKVFRGSLSQLYRGRGQFAAGEVIYCAFLAIQLAAVCIGLWAGASPIAIAVIYLLSELFSCVVMLALVSISFPDLSLRPARPTRRDLAEIGKLTKWNLVIQHAPVLLLHAPVVVLTAAGASAVVVVSFVMIRTLTNLLKSLPIMLSLSSSVELVSLLHKRETERVARLLLATGRLVASVAGSLAAGLLLLGPELLSLWSAGRVRFDLEVAAWLVAANVVGAGSIAVQGLLTYSNNPRPAAVGALLQLTVGLGGSALLAPSYDARGVALALFLGELVVAWIILPIAAQRHFGISAGKYVFHVFAAAVASGLWCTIVLLAAKAAVGSGGYTELIMSGVVLGLLGVLPAMMAGLPRGTRETILQSVASTFHRLRGRPKGV